MGLTVPDQDKQQPEKFHVGPSSVRKSPFHRAAADTWTRARRWRMFDLLRWYADLLLDKAHSHWLSNERNLLFVALNLAETALIGAIWLKAAGESPSALGALYESFGVVTQLGDLSVGGGAAPKIGLALTEITALVLLVGGVAILVGEVQEKLRTTGRWWGTVRSGWRQG